MPLVDGLESALLSQVPVGGLRHISNSEGIPVDQISEALRIRSAHDINFAERVRDIGATASRSRPELEIGSPDTHFTSQPSAEKLLAAEMLARVDEEDAFGAYSWRTERDSLLNMLGCDAVADGHTSDVACGALVLVNQHWQEREAV